MMHCSSFMEEVKRKDFIFFIIKCFPEFFILPRKITALIIRRHISILTRIKSSFRVRKDVSKKMYYPLCDLFEVHISKERIVINIISKKPCIVISHLLKVRNDPCLI